LSFTYASILQFSFSKKGHGGILPKFTNNRSPCMKKPTTLLGKILINLLLTSFTIHLTGHNKFRNKIFASTVVAMNACLFLYTLFTSKYQQMLRSYRQISILLMIAEMIFLVTFYASAKHWACLLNIPLIIACDFYFLYERKIESFTSREPAHYDTGRCIAKLMDDKKLILYPGELVTILERRDGKLLIRKFNGNEHLVDPEYIDENYVVEGY